MNNFCGITGLFLFLVITVLFSGCQKVSKKEKLFQILDSEKTGIDFINTLTVTDEQNILDYLYFYNGGGVAIGDVNGDSLPDIYFTSNQGPNKLYLNKGELKFEDVTEKADVAGRSDWNTGVAMADVNGDGLLDIYVCAVVGIHGFEGKNELFINNGDGTFTDRAPEYVLNFKIFSTAASFFDYDLDGDLDLYLLNHAIHSPHSFGKAELRYIRNENSGDKLLRNDGVIFTDVSEEAGIFGGVNSYGLSASVSDFNADGYPDIYVCNDFYEDDYYYLNNGDGTFSESLKDYFGHVSQFSMGSDVADVNGDGLPDLMTLDMLPYDEKVLKMSGGDFNPQSQKTRIEKLGYHYQFSRNMLQINNQSEYFSEQALLSGVAATDWSWSVLFADYDQDGRQDIFVSNGIPKRPNDLDYINFISDSRIKKMMNMSNAIDAKAMEQMPDGALPNCFFRGEENLQFLDKSNGWCDQTAGYSNGAAFADLDNDGDLDLITNNLNAPASIYENQTNGSANYIKLKLRYINKNQFGIGTKVYLYSNGESQFRELYPQRGFQSSSEPIIHFGLGKVDVVDSIRIVWPDRTFKTVKNIQSNQMLGIDAEGSAEWYFEPSSESTGIRFLEISESLGLGFVHQENDFIDFNFQSLIPFQVSDRGAAVAVGDLNGDGKDDIYLGNAHDATGAIYFQNEQRFVKPELPALQVDQAFEDVSAIIADLDGDGKNELVVGSAGGQMTGKALKNRIYGLGSDLIAQDLSDKMDNTSVIRAIDHDNDGDTDLFVGNGSVTNDYGKTVSSYLLENVNGKLEQTQTFDLGIVTDAISTDFNTDGLMDLLIVGEWMHPTFLENENGIFTDKTDSHLNGQLNGLWRAVFPFDIDADGDMDYLLGNWGKNTKYQASQEFPLQMYYDDFDKNGQSETLIAFERNGKYFLQEGLDMLGKQLVSLTKKKFTRYEQFAGKTVEEVFDRGLLDRAELFEVHILASGVLMNKEEGFVFKEFGSELQVSTINAFTDIKNTDGESMVICAGNYFGLSPYHGRFDGLSGAIIKAGKVISSHELGLNFFNKSVTDLQTVDVNGKQILLAVVNDGKVEVYQLQNN